MEDIHKLIENYYKSIGYVPKVKVKPIKSVFDGLITVHLKHETQKVL
jgi:hypothetical protein